MSQKNGSGEEKTNREHDWARVGSYHELSRWSPQAEGTSKQQQETRRCSDARKHRLRGAYIRTRVSLNAQRRSDDAGQSSVSYRAIARRFYYKSQNKSHSTTHTHFVPTDLCVQTKGYVCT